jgi:hypothetical protein
MRPRVYDAAEPIARTGAGIVGTADPLRDIRLISRERGASRAPIAPTRRTMISCTRSARITLFEYIPNAAQLLKMRCAYLFMPEIMAICVRLRRENASDRCKVLPDIMP